MFDWQNVLTVMVVGGAIGYLALTAWRSFQSRPGCSSCASCTNSVNSLEEMRAGGESRGGKVLPIVELTPISGEADELNNGKHATGSKGSRSASTA